MTGTRKFQDDDWKHALFTCGACGVITHLVLASPDTFPAFVRPFLIAAGILGTLFGAVSSLHVHSPRRRPKS